MQGRAVPYSERGRRQRDGGVGAEAAGATASIEERPVAVDLFCGAGGMSLGFEQAGFDVLAAVDHDPVHLGVHAFNFPNTEVVCEDIGNVTATTIETAARKGWSAFGRSGEWDGTVDSLFGGPSCQGFSFMGHLDTEDERNDLIFDFARLVADVQPRAFVLENVPGLTSSLYRDKVDHLYRKLRRAGYTMQAPRPVRLDAGDYGVPQTRQRVFVVGSRERIRIPVPRPMVGPTVADALDDLPEVEDYENLVDADQLRLTKQARSESARRASSYALSLRARYEYEYKRPWNPVILTGCQRTAHRPNIRARFASLGPGDEDEPSRTRRLDGDGKSRTLRAGTGRDHGSFTAPRPIHHRAPRVITIREAARLHSFPDWFQFHATKWHGLRQIGNAVPPRLAAAVAAEVVAALGFCPTIPDVPLPESDEMLLALSLQQAADRFGFARDRLPLDVRLLPGHRGSRRRRGDA